MSEIAKLNRLLSYMAFRIFKPLVVLFLRNSVPYQTASDWLKRIYVDVAFENKEFRINPAKKQTKTRVAVLTGLSRVEIDRVLKIEKPLEVTEQKWNRATKVLSGWSTDKDYLDGSGKPKKIAVRGELSFSTLVEKYSGGATMRSILDDLVKVKSVTTDENEVVLVRQDYTSEPNKQKLFDLEIAGTSTGDILNTLVFNDGAIKKEGKRYQKFVVAWSIPEENIDEVKRFIYKEADNLLVSIDNQLTAKYTETVKNSKRLGLGAYYFED